MNIKKTIAVAGIAVKNIFYAVPTAIVVFLLANLVLKGLGFVGNIFFGISLELVCNKEVAYILGYIALMHNDLAPKKKKRAAKAIKKST